MSAVLLTGGAGFIGAQLAGALEAAGWRTIGLDNLNPQVHLDPSSSRRRFPGILIEGDVTDDAAWADLPDVNAVVHLAAETGVGQSMYEIDRYRHVNENGTRLAAAFAAQRRVPLIFFSSRAVYGQGRTVCERHGEHFDGACCADAAPAASREDDPLVPVSVYGETKVAGERIVTDAGVPVVIIRPQNVIGAGQALHNPYTGVLAAFLARLREHKALQIYGDGTQTRDFVHVEDVASLVVWSLANLPTGPAPLVVNCGSGVRTSLVELATYATTAAPGEHVEGFEFVDVHRAGDIDHACADLDRLTSIGAPTPTIRAADAVAEFITKGWNEPGASAAAWDRALDDLDTRGLTS